MELIYDTTIISLLYDVVINNKGVGVARGQKGEIRY